MSGAVIDTLFGLQQSAWFTLLCLLAAAFAEPVVREWRAVRVRIGVRVYEDERRPAQAVADPSRPSCGPPAPSFVLPPRRFDLPGQRSSLTRSS